MASLSVRQELMAPTYCGSQERKAIEEVVNIVTDKPLSNDGLRTICTFLDQIRWCDALNHELLQKTFKCLQSWFASPSLHQLLENGLVQVLARTYDTLLQRDYSTSEVLKSVLELLFLIEDISEMTQGKDLCGKYFICRLLALATTPLYCIQLQRAAVETLCALITQCPTNQQAVLDDAASCYKLFRLYLLKCGDFQLQASIVEIYYRVVRRGPQFLDLVGDNVVKGAVASMLKTRPVNLLAEIRRIVVSLNESLGPARSVYSFLADTINVNGHSTTSSDEKWVDFGKSHLSFCSAAPSASNELEGPHVVDVRYEDVIELKRCSPTLLEILQVEHKCHVIPPQDPLKSTVNNRIQMTFKPEELAFIGTTIMPKVCAPPKQRQPVSASAGLESSLQSKIKVLPQGFCKSSRGIPIPLPSRIMTSVQDDSEKEKFEDTTGVDGETLRRLSQSDCIRANSLLGKELGGSIVADCNTNKALQKISIVSKDGANRATDLQFSPALISLDKPFSTGEQEGDKRVPQTNSFEARARSSPATQSDTPSTERSDFHVVDSEVPNEPKQALPARRASQPKLKSVKSRASGITLLENLKNLPENLKINALQDSDKCPLLVDRQTRSGLIIGRQRSSGSKVKAASSGLHPQGDTNHDQEHPSSNVPPLAQMNQTAIKRSGVTAKGKLQRLRQGFSSKAQDDLPFVLNATAEHESPSRAKVDSKTKADESAQEKSMKSLNVHQDAADNIVQTDGQEEILDIMADSPLSMETDCLARKNIRSKRLEDNDTSICKLDNAARRNIRSKQLEDKGPYGRHGVCKSDYSAQERREKDYIPGFEGAQLLEDLGVNNGTNKSKQSEEVRHKAKAVVVNRFSTAAAAIDTSKDSENEDISAETPPRKHSSCLTRKGKGNPSDKLQTEEYTAMQEPEYGKFSIYSRRQRDTRKKERTGKKKSDVSDPIEEESEAGGEGLGVHAWTSSKLFRTVLKCQPKSGETLSTRDGKRSRAIKQTRNSADTSCEMNDVFCFFANGEELNEACPDGNLSTKSKKLMRRKRKGADKTPDTLCTYQLRSRASTLINIFERDQSSSSKHSSPYQSEDGVQKTSEDSKCSDASADSGSIVRSLQEILCKPSGRKSRVERWKSLSNVKAAIPQTSLLQACPDLGSPASADIVGRVSHGAHTVSASEDDDTGLRSIKMVAKLIKSFKKRVKADMERKVATILASTSEKVQEEVQSAEIQIQQEKEEIFMLSKRKYDHVQTVLCERKQKVQEMYEKFQKEIDEHLVQFDQIATNTENIGSELGHVVLKQRESHQRLLARLHDCAKVHIDQADQELASVQKAASNMYGLKDALKEALKAF